MELLLNRIYYRDNCTIGCLKCLNKTSGQWDWVCHTLESHAIAWQTLPLTGQRAGKFIAGHTAIPEGRYELTLSEVRTYKRILPTLLQPPRHFGSVHVRTGKVPTQASGDILVGNLAPTKGIHPSDAPQLEKSVHTLNLLQQNIAKALEHHEPVWLTIRNWRNWVAPQF